MDVVEKSVSLFLTALGESPFEAWLDELLDIRAKQKILARIARGQSRRLEKWERGQPIEWFVFGRFRIHLLAIAIAPSSPSTGATGRLPSPIVGHPTTAHLGGRTASTAADPDQRR